MAKPKRPFPGLRGPLVLALKYDDTWVAHIGGQTENVLKAERRRLPQWSDDKVHIFTNNVGDPSPEEQLA
jgi:hypothetical protein